MAANVKELVQQILADSEYISAVRTYAAGMSEQVNVSNELFAKAFDGFKPAANAQALFRLTQANAVDLMVNAIGNQSFADVVRENIETAISSNAGFTETVRQLQTIVTGDEEVDGKLLQYNKQIAHDTFAIADRNYTSAVSEQLEAEWFFYSGSEIETTRPFFSARHNQYFYYREIEQWPFVSATCESFALIDDSVLVSVLTETIPTGYHLLSGLSSTLNSSPGLFFLVSKIDTANSKESFPEPTSI